MAIMIAPEVVARKKEREYVVFVSKEEAKKIERQLLVAPENKTANSALRNICFILHALVQKYVPNSAATFEDYSRLLRCTQLLQELGLKPDLLPKIKADASIADVTAILNSFEYRQLRNKMIAGLSVIADLTERPASPGTLDYQNGIREGYRRASEIAAVFLKDIDGGV